MKKITIILFSLAIIAVSARAQKSVTRAFSPGVGADTCFTACISVISEGGYAVKKSDAAAGIIEAEKSLDGNAENLLLLSLHTKKYDNGTVVFVVTISKQGKVKADTEELVDDFIHKVSEKNIPLIRFGKNFKE